jgi:phosphatidate cytidylyltransferase
MLKHRLIFGTIMVIVLALVLSLDEMLDNIVLTGFWQDLFLGREYLPSGLLLLLLMLTLIALTSRELCAIFKAEGIQIDVKTVTIASATACVMIYALPYHLSAPTTVAAMTTLTAAVFMVSLVKYSRKGRVQGAVMVGAAAMFAMVYLGFMPSFYLAIRRWHSAWLVAGIIFVCKSCDIGAYFTGRAIGRHKLIPWLSPGKTWEGLLGGIVVSSLVAVGLAMLGMHYNVLGQYSRYPDPRALHTFNVPLWLYACAGGLIGAIGQLGDLTASLFKRDAGIKDSGASIPGFGGFIDVFDSPNLVAPFAYWMLTLAMVYSEQAP